MERIILLLFILQSLFVAAPRLAAAESQAWKVRPGDNLDIIVATLEIPRNTKTQSRDFGNQSPSRPEAETAAELLWRK